MFISTIYKKEFETIHKQHLPEIRNLAKKYPNTEVKHRPYRRGDLNFLCVTITFSYPNGADNINNMREFCQACKERNIH